MIIHNICDFEKAQIKRASPQYTYDDLEQISKRKIICKVFKGLNIYLLCNRLGNTRQCQ